MDVRTINVPERRGKEVRGNIDHRQRRELRRKKGSTQTIDEGVTVTVSDPGPLGESLPVPFRPTSEEEEGDVAGALLSVVELIGVSDGWSVYLGTPSVNATCRVPGHTPTVSPPIVRSGQTRGLVGEVP